uniref:Uncharacterized protein n=1 Tax=Oryza punctata TaxID=4537 RepID=A0A0E0MMX3_ORYPU
MSKRESERRGESEGENVGEGIRSVLRALENGYRGLGPIHRWICPECTLATRSRGLLLRLMLLRHSKDHSSHDERKQPGRRKAIGKDADPRGHLGLFLLGASSMVMEGATNEVSVFGAFIGNDVIRNKILVVDPIPSMLSSKPIGRRCSTRVLAQAKHPVTHACVVSALHAAPVHNPSASSPASRPAEPRTVRMLRRACTA